MNHITWLRIKAGVLKESETKKKPTKKTNKGGKK